MLNEDLLARIRPSLNRFGGLEFIDVCGFVHDIRATSHELIFRASLSPGIYRGEIHTAANSFDMDSARIALISVPEGTLTRVGPFDLDHIKNVMAMPMAKFFVNGRLKGGLWFNMPGTLQIAQGRLTADFGFEVEQDETEVRLEFSESSIGRISWERIEWLELRNDDRKLSPLLPKNKGRTSIFFEHSELCRLRQPGYIDRCREAALQLPPDSDRWIPSHEANDGQFDIACLLYLVLGDQSFGEQAKKFLLKLCSLETWSGRPDPLLMGGENDRGIGHRLYIVAVGWHCLREVLSDAEANLVLVKTEEYLEKIYDFTLLQRGYLGVPTADEHSLGTWYGVGAACMSFYHDLPISRKILPFFHGLMVDSLKLFPPGGKTNWATYCPAWMARYIAAARTFSGDIPSMEKSPFFDCLGEALLASFLVPNAQEKQRGLRTIEHRLLTAFLSRFYPATEIDSIYQAFVETERYQAGDLKLGMFDLLYAPLEGSVPAASFCAEPLYSKDIGEVIAIVSREQVLGVSISAGIKAGARASFSLAAHNREQRRLLGAFELSMNGAPVLMGPDMSYGLNSANFNSICFEDGGALADGQYLHGENAPEKSARIRRCFIDERFVYLDIELTHALKPELEICWAERTFVLDRRSGGILVRDSFEGARDIRFATHLHATGKISYLSDRLSRLTGGQANLIAGTKGGSKGLSDEEYGELFAEVLDTTVPFQVTIKEVSWVPSYIYGINGTYGNGSPGRMENAKYPHFLRWRLEAVERVNKGALTYGVSQERGLVRKANGGFETGEGARILFDGTAFSFEQIYVEAETVLLDESRRRLIALGATIMSIMKRKMSFVVAVDIEVELSTMSGWIHSATHKPVDEAIGITVSDFKWTPYHTRSSGVWEACFITQGD